MSWMLDALAWAAVVVVVVVVVVMVLFPYCTALHCTYAKLRIKHRRGVPVAQGRRRRRETEHGDGGKACILHTETASRGAVLAAGDDGYRWSVDRRERGWGVPSIRCRRSLCAAHGH
ncbi:hypothetical protein JOL62DRAFT_580578 [Phyllosticta paracitricarpa]|uniref:Uncharacterized protein n=1 Tax=Phyllosticta paracitricarpa TaxID=2016321 RepID=A0ABR1N0P0_9PEZI